MKKAMSQIVEINTENFFLDTMIIYSYDEFAQLITETVNKADTPEELAEIIRTQFLAKNLIKK
jgi:hypothetical protein